MSTDPQLQQPTPAAPISRPSLGAPPKFNLLAELGKGGMATVYLAVVRGPAGFNKLIVVKCLRPSLAAEAEFREMFLAEARLAARINHPNVVQTNEIGFDGQFHFIVMEYIEGTTLESIVRKAGAGFPVAVHIHILMQVLAGLHHAHELKDFEGKPLEVVHRDVSPHNIMVSYDGQVKLVDFGIAKAADSGEHTRTGVLKGKCAYMATEQLGNDRVDRRADVFAAGVCLWQALTHRRLWKGLTDAEILLQLVQREIPSPTSIVPDLPQPLVDICMRALAPRREDRFATAADFLGALEEFVNRHPEYRATNRDLTKFVSSLFAEERAAMQATVDEKLSAVARDGGDLVSFQAESPSGAFSATSTPVHRSRRKSPRLALIGAAAVIALAGGAFLFARQRPSPTGAVVGAEATVSIEARPVTAKLFFDDAPLAGNPATASFARDGLSHRVRAEAQGFAPRTELVLLDSAHVAIDLVLEAEVVAQPEPVRSERPTATLEPAHAPMAPAVVRAGGGKPASSGPTSPLAPSPTSAPSAPSAPATAPTQKRKDLDQSDPWAN